MFKKITTAFVLTTFLSLFATPLGNSAIASSEEETLASFMKTTENITASYTYPSMKLAINAAGKSKIQAHTPIVIRCEETITTSNLVNGSTVNFSVLNDVKDPNGLILIKAGTPVSAQISFSKNKGMIGKSGELRISDFHTTAVDGTYIPLSGSVSAKPDDKMVMSIVLSVLICPLFLLIKGDEAQMPAGTTKTAYTVVETYVKTNAY